VSDERIVGVLGGTFDPVHLGHLEVARRVRERTGLARVLLLPCAIPPHKQPPRLAPAAHREAMLRLAIEGLDDLELCTLESESGGVRYSIDTMRRLREGPPRRIPVFIMGMDSLLELPAWKDHRDLIREFDLIAVNRPDAGRPRAVEDPEVARAIVELAEGEDGPPTGLEAGMGRGGRIFVFRIPPVAVSSSRVRARVASGGSLAGLVPPAVARYIHANGLYLQEERS